MAYCVQWVNGNCNCTNNVCGGGGFTPDDWRISSYSGGDNGSQCVAVHRSLQGLRDSKNPGLSLAGDVRELALWAAAFTTHVVSS